MHRHGATQLRDLYVLSNKTFTSHVRAVCVKQHKHLKPFSSSCARATEAQEERVQEPRVRRMKKIIAELPTALIGPDGLPIASLEPWSGGLPPSVPPKPSAKSSSDEDKQSLRKPRRKRTAPADGSVIPAKGAQTMGKLSSNLLRTDEDIAQQPSTPLALEILDNLAKFPHCILLTRVGQFYESYFDQAAEVAKLLNTKLTSKSWGGRRVPMTGFPVINLNKYLKVLVQDNRRFVAICDEFIRDRTLGPKGGFNRRVNRIVTPGTLIDEPFLNPYENHYLLAIDSAEIGQSDPNTQLVDKFGLAWMDVSTGDFFTKSVASEALQDELARIAPKEVVLSERHEGESGQFLRQQTAEEGYFVSYISGHSTGEEQSSSKTENSGADDLISLQHDLTSGPACDLTASEQAAVKLLSTFLSAHLFDGAPRLSSPSHETIGGRMQIDSHTIKALELKESIREGGTTGSLLSTIKRTVTSGGTRLLSRWICSPSASVAEINARQSLVAFFHARPHLRADIVQNLGQLEDTTRIVQKFLLLRGGTYDLVALCATIHMWNTIKNRLESEKEMELNENARLEPGEWASIDAVISRINSLKELASRITSAVVSDDALQEQSFEDTVEEDTTLSTKTGVKSPLSFQTWTIQPHFSPDLAALHDELHACIKAKDELEARMRKDYSSPSLTLRSSPGQGMHVHVGRAKRDSAKIRADSAFIPMSTSETTSTFFHREWSQLGTRMVELSGAIYDAEKAAFETLREDVNAHSAEIRKNSRIMDELDVTIGYANLAEELKLVRPAITEEPTYHVVNGRHPTVELGLLSAGKVFRPNTVSFALDSPLHVITGPNMAGKSTLLRQTALIAILAQTGSFVPADSANIGVIDRIFSRVGAKDDLFRNRSTFMVEMLETADILRRATPNSLVIMDEVGRGTTVEDGLAIAFATVHHLLLQNRCRTLFATHFHELADLLGYTDAHRGQGSFSGVSFFCTDVDETEDGYFTYSHRLKPGINRDSHGLKAAQLAGMPESAITVAAGALQWLRQRRTSTDLEGRSELQALGSSLAQGHKH